MAKPLMPLIAGALGIEADQLRPDASMRNTPRWDSLRQFLLMLEIERAFGVRMSNAEMVECSSVEQIRTLLADRGIAPEEH